MKRKKQPSAEVYREQLRLAADEIIRLKTEQDDVCSILRGDRDHLLNNVVQPWWRKIFVRLS